MEATPEKGFALLLALIMIVTLSALALSVVALTDSQIRLGKTTETQTGIYYAALAGLEETRGRLNASAPDTIAPSVPLRVTDVVYLVNSRTQDPVQPVSPSSPYFDYEYASEFPGGFGSATVLPAIASDQPGAGTVSAIPYKWVRITLKTEYSSHQDINQDGVMDRNTLINWYRSNQDLVTAAPGGVPVYKLTALAVDPSGIRKLVQAEVAGANNAYTLGALATAGSASLTGVTPTGSWTGSSANLFVNGNDWVNSTPCGPAALPGLLAGSTMTRNGPATILGSPPTQTNSPLPLSVSALIASLQTSATPILTADPAHVTSSGSSYTGTNTVLGTQASPPATAHPSIVYADKSLSLSGANGGGEGALLVNGNLTISGGFSYRGLIIVNGNIILASNSSGSISIKGSMLSSGNITADSSASSDTSLTVTYDSCAFGNINQIVPKSILAARELSY